MGTGRWRHGYNRYYRFCTIFFRWCCICGATEVDTEYEKGAAFGVVESIKSVSDLFIPVSGKVIESNSEIADTPELVNSDAYSAWMIKVQITNPSELDELLDSSAYAEHCKNQ